MSFTSSSFFVLLFLTLLLYWISRSQKVRLSLLLAASYIFYFEWSYKYSLLLVFSTVLDYSVGLLMARSSSRRTRRALLICSVMGNLGVLGMFKYYNFFVDAFVRFSTVFGLHVSLPVANVLLPVGLSFYTFQTMSYTIDLYRGKVEPCKSLLQFSVFVAFFPQLVAGPIERAANLLPQLGKLDTSHVGSRDVLSAIRRILWGLFKKLVIANSIALQVDYYFKAYDQLGWWGTVLGAIGFSVQIYCDFSAYSDIAIGTAALFGIEITENFRSPYLSVTPQDFWRRWHITLSTWFRDYLYFPLGGSRTGPWRTYFNLMFVMIMVGLWHGANYTFVLWGVLHGLSLMAHRIIKRSDVLRRVGVQGAVSSIAGWMATFIVVQLGWVLFRAESLSVVRDMLHNLVVAKPNTLQVAHLDLFGLWLAIMILEHICVELYYRSAGFRDAVNSLRFQYVSLGFLITVNSVFFLRGEMWDTAFIYFAF